MSLERDAEALEPRERETLPPEPGSHVSVHPDEDTGKELDQFGDLMKGLPALADEVRSLANELPQIRLELAEMLGMKPQLELILKLIQEAVDAGIEAAAGHAEVKHLYDELEARVKHSEHENSESNFLLFRALRTSRVLVAIARRFQRLRPVADVSAQGAAYWW